MRNISSDDPDPVSLTPEQRKLNEDYMAAVERGDMETAQRMVDEEAAKYIEEYLLPNDEDESGFKYHRGPAPTKTFKRYAVLNVSPDGFRAAYAGNANPTPLGVWLDAQNLQSYMSDMTQFDDGSFATYIPGGTGAPTNAKFSPERIKEYGLRGGQRWLMERGGKHSSDVPNFSQMNLRKNENGETVTNAIRDGALPHNKLIFEIEYGASDDGDLTEYVKEHGRKIKGKNQGLAKIQPNQYYDFKTNPNAVGKWGIGGTFRIVRLVPYSEVVSVTNKYKENAIKEAQRLYDAGEISKADFNAQVKNANAIQVQKWVNGYHPEDFGLNEKTVQEMVAKGMRSKLTDAVTYDDAGEVIPLSQRFNEKKADPRFSMKAPVEETDRLIAWHNISSSVIDGAIELGGFAMPSFAVKPADQAHEGYGDISVIARRESIDPEQSKDQSIFAGDAWTPVFPETGVKINERAARTAENRVRALLEAAGMTGYYSLALDADNLADQIKRWGSFAEAYGNKRELKLAFLQDKGRAVAIPKKDKSYSRLADIPTLRRVARTVDINDRNDIMKYEPAVRKLVRDYYIKRFGETVANRLHPEDKALSFSEMDNIIYGAQQLMDSGETKETDTARLDKRLENAMRAKKTQTEYKAWLNDLSKDFVERRGVRNNKSLFTPSGNRRGFDALYDDYTLANIVRAMRSQPKQGRSAFLSGAGSVKGAALSEFKSIEDVRAARGRLTSELDARGKRAYNEFNAAVERVAKVFDPDIFDGAAALADVLSHAKTKPAIERYLKREYLYLQSQNGVNISTLASDIYDLIPLANALPQEYFESKVYRGFPFSEAAAVVVPNTLPKETQQKLRDLGANVITYKAGDQADRLDVHAGQGADPPAEG